ncbi:MAG: hypothetical protein P1U56_17255 [Saprospiraceae bacterium]|nr:hypothetical protein [Saprospiraceae bacterium]
MNILSRLTPAETSFLKEGNSISFTYLLKVTFKDLLLKNVLTFKEITPNQRALDPSVNDHTYVVAGKNFSNYIPKNHEIVFLELYQQNPHQLILLRHFMKIVYDVSKGDWAFKKKIRSNASIEHYYKKSFISDLFRMIRMTETGKDLKRRLSDYFFQLDQTIGGVFKNDTPQATKLFRELGGNILLLKNFHHSDLTKVDFTLLKKIQREKKVIDDHDIWIYSDPFYTNVEFDPHISDFDKKIDELDEEANDSGGFFSDSDGWDSGCDGCSGCGGCGGCD